MADKKDNGEGAGKGVIGSELKDLPMEYLIGAPLNAAIKAQVEMGKAMISFVNMLAFGEEMKDGKANAVKGATARDVVRLPMKLVFRV